jgi:cyclic beta-1,2-glucan synthetase
VNGDAGSATASDSRPTCPGLSSHLRWDEAACLRGELYTEEHLVAHAIELAACHGKPRSALTPGPLRQRFAAARKRIHEAYRILAEEARHRREPTPAEEWLLDNANVVEDQLREIAEDLPLGYLLELPRLASGEMRGFPRVYGLCIDYLRHTDARIDLRTLGDFVIAYQGVAPLTIGELWAVPIMLRLGLSLGVGALAASEAAAQDRARADTWAERLLQGAATPFETGARLRELEQSRQPVTAAFLVQLLHRLREHDATPELARAWVAERCAAMGTTPDELARREHFRRAADQVSVGNAITSMRAVSAFDWDAFFERTSEVEAVLRRDPASAYAESDKPTRDRYRHAVEALARRGKSDEVTVARQALELCETARATLPAAPDAAQAVRCHVGYYLVDAGRPELERRVHYRPTLGGRIVRALLAWPTLFYLGTIGLFTLALLGAALQAWLGALPFDARLALFLLLFALPASEIALALTSSLAVTICPPRLLAGLGFEQGIPDQHRTLVAVPVLIDSPATVEQLLEDLEVRSLANPDPNLYFALLTDHTDAEQQTLPSDAALVELAERGIQELNARRGGPTPRYWLLHRGRRHNPKEGVFMGWERKRGKLEELNRLLQGALDTSFSVVSAPRELLSSIRYVLTLDADTELPRDVGRRLVAKLAHPLNRPNVDEKTRRVTRGHGIIQPRVGTLPLSSRRSRFAAIAAGSPGIDPYTTAVSDVYQDLFGEGSFVGKGIYDLATFQRVMGDRTPENRLLSHDLFEGIYARSALATDIEVLDEQPSAYHVQVGRQHRWLRGDWQLLPWLLPRVPAVAGSRPNDLRLLDAWKIFDNLRRSLLAPGLVLLVVSSWFLQQRVAGAVAAVVLGVFFMPMGVRLLLDLVRESSQPSRSFLGSLGGDLRANSRQLLLTLVFTLDQAWVSLDAIARTCWRLLVGRRLLEWTTMRQTAQAGTNLRVQRRLWAESVACLGTAVALGFANPGELPLCAPLLVFWAAAPFVARWLAGPLALPEPLAGVSAADRRLLRRTARKTWRFFDTFVTADEHFLPPDNYQEDPRGVVAQRTSPTNIGLYLLSVVSAREFGFIGLRQALERLRQTLTTMERLEKREGHLLNWYDTSNLQPLEPRYVSTVDSGNLAAYLWTLREACEDLARAPVLSGAVLDAARDAVALAAHDARSAPSPSQRELRALEHHLEGLCEAQPASSPGTAPQALADALHAVQECRAAPWSRSLDASASYWLEQAELGLQHAQREAAELSPAATPLPSGSPLWARPELASGLADLDRCLAEAGSPVGIVAARARGLEIAQRLEAALAATTPSAEQREACERELDACVRRLEAKADACSELLAELAELGARALALADGMSFRFLFDEQRELFSIGYNVSSARLDPSHYDLLASEARLASMWCIAKGEVPQRHWFRLARPRAALSGGRALLSWSGSMFEYLMPLLLMRSNPQTLLAEGCATAVDQQRRYGAERGVPWGISESAYNVMDLRMTYQYRAFGVPGLGLKAGLGEDLVVAPYATVLAGLVRPDLISRNLRALAEEGLDGPYGFYESIDYTPEHVPPGRRGVIVKAFMAHHQGMSLVALDNILNGAPMQQRFHRHPRIKAAELLLEERVPARSPLVDAPAPMHMRATEAERRIDVLEHVGRSAPGPLRAHLLGHGELSSLVTATGAGVITWKGLDINRFREDPLLDGGGIYIYVQNRSQARTWSTAYQPTRTEPDYYNVAFAIDRVEFHRRDGDVQTVTEVALSPEHPAEVRRITLTNHGHETLELELTSFSEVVLAERRADVGHRAFSSMFVETEALAERHALLAQRRPRGAGEAAVWMAQILSAEDEGWGPLDFDTSRPSFLGRGRGPEAPLGLERGRELARRTGNVLDPALVLRRVIRLAPGASSRATLITALASSREELLGLVGTYSAQHSVARAFELGWAGVRVELRHLGITATEVHRFQRLLSAVVFPQPALRVGTAPPSNTPRGISALWAHGISGDLPIVLLRLDHPEYSEVCHDLLLAHEFWRLNGFACDLVLLNEEPSSYLQSAHDQVRDLIQRAQVDQRGGVFLRRSDQMSEEERELIACAARVVVRASQGSLARQLRRAAEPRAEQPRRWPLAAGDATRASMALPAGTEGPDSAARSGSRRPSLALDNGLGGFADGGKEYVIVLEPGLHTPAPWCNVMANPSFGSLVTESGSSFTWIHNSQRYRLTPWSNDPVSDPSGELLYVRDDETGASWSPTPRPAGLRQRYVVRHTPGCTTFELEANGLGHELSMFVSPSEALKFSRLRLQNRSGRRRRLSLFGVVEWVLGGSRENSRVSVCSSWDAELGCLFASNPLSPFPAQRAFFLATRMPASFSADREEFFGQSGSRRSPRALGLERLSGSVGAGFDPCAALQVTLELAPGETTEVSFVLGHAPSSERARALAAKHGPSAPAEHAGAQLEQAIQAWERTLGAVRVETPDPALDALLNHWLVYQALSSRIWARTGFYQSSGAYGFRDQLQDVLALLHTRPELAREHLLRCAARQFVEGDVQHWWHEETGEGLRTRCSDDLLWLPYVTAEYVRFTGDRGVLDESIPFLTERVLAPGEEDLFSSPAVSESRASLYEHCTRALDVGSTSGPHELPTMRGGDWNDGMNRVGQHGQGESVWLAWFLARTLLDFAPIAQARGDEARAGRCRQQISRLTRALEKSAWDGEWYRRAYFDDGTPLGSKQNEECSIDAIAQSWAVIAGIGDRERAAQAVSAAESHLIRQRDRLMCLLDPPFQHASPDPGYIRAYPPGIRENGGQYTHGVLWTIQALTLLREGDRAGALLELLNPVHHADSPEAVQRYRVEPYVVAADVYAGNEHAGRGGWTWYTGSAGWMYRIALERVLGVRRLGKTLSIAPCVPSHWARYELHYRYLSATYHVTVDNPQRVSYGVVQLELDGKLVREGYVRLVDDGKTHELRVTLGNSEVVVPQSQRDPRFRAG